MCGITGFLCAAPVVNGEDLLHRMGRAINYRGPDDDGVWLDATKRVGLGHRRLSILDTTSAGHQPMQSDCGRYVIVFNGEIYNHLALRESLDRDFGKRSWISHSDTETLLYGLTGWGAEKFLQSASGMFAFALWDNKRRNLILARDRIGEKPLYFGWQEKSFLFSSDLSAIKTHPSFKGVINRNSLALYLRYNYVPAPHSIYQGVFKLKPGCLLELSLESGEKEIIRPYWNFDQVVKSGLANPFHGSPGDAINTLHSSLLDSVESQMLSDVPLGAFLSGGIDSSLIVSLMQDRSTKPVQTFTIGSDDSEFNEAGYAKKVASHLGSDHTELYVNSSDALAVIPILASTYSEPFSDSSQIPTYLVSQLARQNVTVALSGDGGDELFGGYNRYLSARRIWRAMQLFPLPLRQFIGYILYRLSPSQWDQVFNILFSIIPRKYRFSIPGEKAHKLADIVSLKDGIDFYKRLISQWPSPESVVIGAEEPNLFSNNKLNMFQSMKNIEEWMMAIDAQTYLPDDILVKVDRAAMANSLETRVPFLDHQIVELAWQLPLSYKIRGGQGKWLLRQILNKYVPKNLIERPKMGFGVPLASWLRGALKDWAECLLDEDRLRQEGFFDPSPIRSMWEQHLSGRYNRQYYLWPILMFQAWLQEEKNAFSSRG